MFRSPEYSDRYEYIPVQLYTPITTPGAGVAQRKNEWIFAFIIRCPCVISRPSIRKLIR